MSALSFGELESRAAANGQPLPPGIPATVLEGAELPGEDFVALFAEACGCAVPAVAQWVEARNRAASPWPELPMPGTPSGDPSGDPSADLPAEPSGEWPAPSWDPPGYGVPAPGCPSATSRSAAARSPAGGRVTPDRVAALASVAAVETVEAMAVSVRAVSGRMVCLPGRARQRRDRAWPPEAGEALALTPGQGCTQ
jgi:hypothetical protein